MKVTNYQFAGSKLLITVETAADSIHLARRAAAVMGADVIEISPRRYIIGGEQSAAMGAATMIYTKTAC